MPIVSDTVYVPVALGDKELSSTIVLESVATDERPPKRCRRRLWTAVFITLSIATIVALVLVLGQSGDKKHHHSCSGVEVSAFDAAVFVPMLGQCVMMVKMGDNFYRLAAANEMTDVEMIQKAKECRHGRSWQEALVKNFASIAGAEGRHIQLTLQRDIGDYLIVEASQSHGRWKSAQKHWGIEGCDNVFERHGYTNDNENGFDDRAIENPVGIDINIDIDLPDVKYYAVDPIDPNQFLIDPVDPVDPIDMPLYQVDPIDLGGFTNELPRVDGHQMPIDNVRPVGSRGHEGQAQAGSRGHEGQAQAGSRGHEGQAQAGSHGRGMSHGAMERAQV